MILHGNFFEIMLQWKKIKFKIFIYSLMELEMKITCTCHQAKITICCQTPLVTPIAPKICTGGFFNMLNPNLPSDLLSDHSSNTRCMHSVWRRIHACLLPIYHHWFIATHYSAQENTLAALTHYMRYGTLSGRLAVLSNNGIPDRGKSGISTKMAPKIHIETLI